MSCGKIGLLYSKSRSQRRFKMSANICLDDIFWTTKHFVTKLGMVMQQNEPECHAEQKLFALFKGKVTAKAHLIKIWLLPLYLLNCWFFATKLDLIIGYDKPEHLVEKLGCCHWGINRWRERAWERRTPAEVMHACCNGANCWCQPNQW